MWILFAIYWRGRSFCTVLIAAKLPEICGGYKKYQFICTIETHKTLTKHWQIFVMYFDKTLTNICHYFVTFQSVLAVPGHWQIFVSYFVSSLSVHLHNWDTQNTDKTMTKHWQYHRAAVFVRDLSLTNIFVTDKPKVTK